jgi:hypothetical protein
LQASQRSAKQLPCSSAMQERGTPDLRCRLSTFWEHTYLTLPVGKPGCKAV